MSSDLARLLRNALSSGDVGLLEQLRQRGPEVRELLLGSDVELDASTCRVIEEHPERLAWLYEALSEVVDTHEDSEAAEIQQIQAQELAKIGDAFIALTFGLPGSLLDLTSWFGELPRVEPDLVEVLREQPDVQVIGPAADELAARGLRPLSVFYAAEAVSLFLEQMQRQGWLDPERPVFLDAAHDIPLLTPGEREKRFPDAPPLSAGEDVVGAITPERLFEEVTAMAECPWRAAPLLLRWLISVAQVKPRVFGRFIASPKAGGVELSRCREGEADGDLIRRWR
jgi:hypothetical protein